MRVSDRTNWIFWRLLLVFAMVAGLNVPAQSQATMATAGGKEITKSAKDVLARVRPSVIQVEGLYDQNSAPSFHGTGFAVAKAGLFVTSYHVVAPQVRHPKRYRLEYRTPDAKRGKRKTAA